MKFQTPFAFTWPLQFFRDDPTPRQAEREAETSPNSQLKSFVWHKNEVLLARYKSIPSSDYMNNQNIAKNIKDAFKDSLYLWEGSNKLVWCFGCISFVSLQ